MSHFVGMFLLIVFGAGVLLAHLAFSLGGSAPAPAWLSRGVGELVRGWLIKFVGHWHELRKPAFACDIVGLLGGPMFGTAEAMFFLYWNEPLMAGIGRCVGTKHLRDLARIV